MFRRYHHGHSIFVGFLIGLLFERHLLVLALLCFIAGLIAGRTWSFWAQVSWGIREKILHAKRERIETKPVPVYRTHSEQVAADDPRWNDEDWPFRKDAP